MFFLYCLVPLRRQWIYEHWTSICRGDIYSLLVHIIRFYDTSLTKHWRLLYYVHIWNFISIYYIYITNFRHILCQVPKQTLHIHTLHIRLVVVIDLLCIYRESSMMLGIRQTSNIRPRHFHMCCNPFCVIGKENNKWPKRFCNVDMFFEDVVWKLWVIWFVAFCCLPFYTRQKWLTAVWSPRPVVVLLKIL